MLELGKAGTHGMPKGVLPVLRDGEVVATLRSTQWKEAATATIGDREWVFGKSQGELTARWSEEPEGTARMRSRQTSLWKSTRAVELEGRPVEVSSVSTWTTGHRFTSGGREIAESSSTGGWSPRPTLSAEESVPLHQQVFLLWTEMVLHRRMNTAVNATMGAAFLGVGS